MNNTAFIVGTGDGPFRSLSDIARGAGFNIIKPFKKLSEVEQQTSVSPICFLLFSQVPDVAILSDIVHPIRACKRQGVRFMPLIYFCEDPSREAIRGCITMGFDDVITIPFSFDCIQRRLERHLDNPVTYFETAEYFGPNRRQDVKGREAHGRTSNRSNPHQIFEFSRSSVAGIIHIDKKSDAA